MVNSLTYDRNKETFHEALARKIREKGGDREVQTTGTNETVPPILPPEEENNLLDQSGDQVDGEHSKDNKDTPDTSLDPGINLSGNGGDEVGDLSMDGKSAPNFSLDPGIDSSDKGGDEVGDLSMDGKSAPDTTLDLGVDSSGNGGVTNENTSDNILNGIDSDYSHYDNEIDDDNNRKDSHNDVRSDIVENSNFVYGPSLVTLSTETAEIRQAICKFINFFHWIQKCTNHIASIFS